MESFLSVFIWIFLLILFSLRRTKKGQKQELELPESFPTEWTTPEPGTKSEPETYEEKRQHVRVYKPTGKQSSSDRRADRYKQQERRDKFPTDASPYPSAPPQDKQSVKQTLHNPSRVRETFICTEILGRPKSMQ